MVTIALTSIPPRFETLAFRLRALIAQGPDRLCFTIPHSYRRFPDWQGVLPDLPPGVEILRSEDYGPATKFVGVFAGYPNEDILIADDDCDYACGWLADFRAARQKHPNAVIAASTFDSARLKLPPGHRIVQGYAGVLIRPQQLGSATLEANDPAIWVDDIWLTARIAHAGLAILPCPDAFARVTAQPAPAALQGATIGGRTRAELNQSNAQRLQAQLGIWQHPV